MDLRIVKTQKAICDAFLTLREKMPLEKIKVRDICEMALINKSTFYSHYTDVFDLSDKMENAYIERMTDIENPALLFENPKAFFSIIHESMKDYHREGEILFTGRCFVFCEKYVAKLTDVFKQHGLEKEITALSFILGGIASTKFASGDFHGNMQAIPDEIVTYITAIRDVMQTNEESKQ